MTNASNAAILAAYNDATGSHSDRVSALSEEYGTTGIAMDTLIRLEQAKTARTPATDPAKRSPRASSAKMQQAMEMIDNGITIKEIARRLSVSDGTVYNWRNKLRGNPARVDKPDPPRRKPAVINKEFDEEVDKMIEEVRKDIAADEPVLTDEETWYRGVCTSRAADLMRVLLRQIEAKVTITPGTVRELRARLSDIACDG